MFHGIEKSYTDAMIRTLRLAQQTLFETPIHEAVSKSHVQHKGDTLGLDQRPENAIAAALSRFDPYCITITEERGAVNPFISEGNVPLQGARTFFCCDPFDRSNQACKFFADHGKDDERIIDVVRHPDSRDIWEKEYGAPISISSSSSAITCVRRGLPIASVILNHFAEEITVACPAGIYHAKLPGDLSTTVNLDYIQERGKRLEFSQPDDDGGRRIVAFIGKPERGYPANFANCRLINETDLGKHIYYDLAGGPSRILYLSALQPKNKLVGVVVANGEKIGEWIHWLTFIRFAQRTDDRSAPALRIFEVSQNQSLMIDGYLMMPSTDYSIFVNVEGSQRRMLVSSERLQRLENPSKYRATLILVTAKNRWAIQQVEQYGYREIVF